MAEAIPTSFDEFAVVPGAARRGDVLSVSGRVAAGDSAPGSGMVWIEFDVGGGPGVYACWLAMLGYEVHLYDPVPLHVAQAEEASAPWPTTWPSTSRSAGPAT